MFKLLCLECKRALFNIRIIISVGILAFIIYNNFDGSDVINCLDFICLRFSFIAVVLAIASAAYSDSICEDFEYKYVRSIWMRISMYKYVICKAIACFFSSVFVFLCGYFIALVALINKLGLPGKEEILLSYEGNDSNLYKEYLQDDSFFMYAFLIGIHIAVLAGLMSLIAIMVSTYINNKFFLYMAPNAILVIGDMFLQRILGWRVGSVFSLYSFGTIGITSPVDGMKIWLYYAQIIIWSVVLISLLIKRCNKMVE